MVSGASHLSSSSTNLMRELVARRLFRVPTCHKGTFQLQTPMSSPGFEPRPYGTAISITNQYTGWAARLRQSQGIGVSRSNGFKTGLVARLHAACTTMGTALVRGGHAFIPRRAQACLDIHGRHFEHLSF
ncbi:hypothetical protein TNCV_2168691 [Trichonephila clavipes]|nr:hypothetical protein TNCV_2168691 [Trichonephila clavipes]